MSESVRATNEAQFENDVVQSTLPVLVDFWAEWCGPCKMLVPVLEEVAREYQGRIHFFKLNVDENNKLATQYRVMSIPYLVLFKGGRVIASAVGSKTKSQLTAFIDEHLG